MKDRSCHPLYFVWKGIIARCTKPTDAAFPDYGGRGIGVCHQWLDFDTFVADMGERPTPDHQIERINNDRGYELTNCRWATAKEQANNRRSSHVITVDGVSHTAAEWGPLVGLDSRTIGSRIRAGWDPAAAVKTPRIRERRDNPTHCPKGHPYSAENTGVQDGSRYCKTCRREVSKRCRLRREAEARKERDADR
jgi:hypothetical protein